MASSEKIKRFADITLGDRAAVGGKGGSLGELTRAGIAVPSGLVISTAAFEQFLSIVEEQMPVRRRVEALDEQDLNGTVAFSDRLRLLFESTPIPEDLRVAIIAAHVELSGHDQNFPLAIRSSATTEDTEEASFAGLQDSYLWVKGAEAMLTSIRSCWASLYSAPSISYRRKHRFPESGVAIAAVVQKMVNARTAGVMFTRSPVSGDRSVIAIEATWGLGSALVSGEVTPDRFVIAKITGEISVREIADKHVRHVPVDTGGVEQEEIPEQLRRTPCVSDQELAELKDVGVRVERHFGRPQDIEWAIDHLGHLYVLQSRPETVWSRRDQAPLARAAENPFQHVMNIFGGRR
jgi:pyruvate,water dikinase